MKPKIKYIKGNIFTSNAQTLVNTVNCVGVMGAGIALEFKLRYPDMYEKYVRYCQDGLIQVGKLWIYEISGSSNKVLNFPTKQHWKYPSKYEYLQKGLNRFVETYKEKGITSAAFPMLGALNGGLDPDKVLEWMMGYLDLCDIPIEIYEYDADSPDDLLIGFKNFFLNANPKVLEKETGFKPNIVKKVREILDKKNLNSLIQLSKIKGIGEETIKECFKVAMNIKSQSLAVPSTIFNNVDKRDYSSKSHITFDNVNQGKHEKPEIELYKNKSNDDFANSSEKEEMFSKLKLFLIICGYYDNLSGGLYESKMNLFVVAENIELVRKKVTSLKQFKQHNMHIDTIQEIEMVDGFNLNFTPTNSKETKVYNHILRELI